MYKIYSISECSWCEKAKQFAKDVDLDWAEYRLNNAEEVSKFFEEKDIQSPNRTFPRIYKVDEKGVETLLGGYRELLNEFTAV